MSDDGFTPPSRERFREERRAIKAAKRRSRLVGIPAVVLGVSLLGAGAWIFTQNDPSGSDVDVQGTSVERSTTTTSTSTTTTSTTTTTTTTTLPPTTLAPTTTAKPKPKPKPATTVAPVDTTAVPATAPPAT